MGAKSSKLKQSTSYFDLTSSHQIDRQDDHNNIRHLSPKATNWLGDNGEAYSLSNANIGVSRPIMVLPCKPISPALHLKKSNAGAASRILHQRQQQQQRYNELKKFSDSLPSLNNLLPQSPRQSELIHHSQSHHHNYNNQNCSRQIPNITNHINNHNNKNLHHQCNKQPSSPNSAIQQATQLHSYNQVTNNLVNKNNDPFYHRQPWQAQFDIEKQQHCLGQQQLMKRATSLSSLHNLNQNRQHQHYEQQQQTDMVNCSKAPFAFNNNDNKISLKQNHQLKPPACRPESMNSNCSPSQQAKCDLQKQPYNLRHSSHLKSPPQLHYKQYNPPAVMAKKIFKYKQAPNGNGQALKNNRYKLKQQQPQQQGCPVLPPLPRSQSLHELIQLRATENGQRMRTTGTLRGPLNGSEPANKVNLVAELLECRRQQKQQSNEENELTNRNSSTLLSQSSSTDDGIHDVSITGDNNSTSGSQRQRFLADNQHCALDSQYHEPSQGKQHIFRKQPISNSRFGQNVTNGPYETDNVNDQQQQQKSLAEGRESRSFENHQQPQKSTLKRSLSHSALHQSNSNLDQSGDQDGNESDDLNELAKFLYQFKKLQADKRTTTTTNFNSQEDKQAVEVNKKDKQSLTTASSSLNSQVTSNLQQSPNSTTSSGFASSTCTSQSTSSSDGIDDANRRRGKLFEMTNPSVSSHEDDSSSKRSVGGRKKYPAPPRPDEQCSKLASSNSSKTKCPISGKLKLSSSLLSIVDEYQSTLNANDRSSPALVACTTNLASVLMGTDQKKPLTSKVENKKQTSRLDDESVHSQQCKQLEQLKRYTQLRQMSQSELALNHLTASAALDPTARQQLSSKGLSICDQADQQRTSSGGRPYKNRLINLIRRISDKSEVGSHRGSGRSSSGGSVGGKSKSSAVGGQHPTRKTCQVDESAPSESKAINQNGMHFSYSDHCGQKKCTNQDREHQQLRLGISNKQYSQTSADAKMGCFSESLCDLNFDCDFELIKNCGSSNEYDRTKVASTSVQHKSSSLLSTTDLKALAMQAYRNNELELPNNKFQLIGKKQQQQHLQQAINSSKGENNWRLAPASSIVATNSNFATAACGESKERHHYNGNNNNRNHNSNSKHQQPPRGQLQSATDEVKGKNSHSKLHDAANDKLAGQSGKLKWSASAWLMNAGNSNKKNKLQQKKQVAEVCSSKNYLDKLTQDSGVPSKSRPVSSNINGGDMQKTNATKQDETNYEADKLLVELDNSLNLVSNATGVGQNFSRKAPMSWWQDKSSMLQDMRLSISLSDSDDESNDADYASINQAMINETFDVNLNKGNDEYLNSQLSIEPGSPSDSFTFSAPNSPAPSPKGFRSSNDSKSLSSTSNDKGESHLQKIGGPLSKNGRNNINNSKQNRPKDGDELRKLGKFKRTNNFADLDSPADFCPTSQGATNTTTNTSGVCNDATASTSERLADNGHNGCNLDVSGRQIASQNGLKCTNKLMAEESKLAKGKQRGLDVNSTFTKVLPASGIRFCNDASQKMLAKSTCSDTNVHHQENQCQNQLENGCIRCQAQQPRCSDKALENGGLGVCCDKQGVSCRSSCGAAKSAELRCSGRNISQTEINLNGNSSVPNCPHGNDNLNIACRLDEDQLTSKFSRSKHFSNDHHHHGGNDTGNYPNHSHADRKRLEANANCSSKSLAANGSSSACLQHCRSAMPLPTGVKGSSATVSDDSATDSDGLQLSSTANLCPIQGQSTFCTHCCDGCKNGLRQQLHKVGVSYCREGSSSPLSELSKGQNGGSSNGHNMEVDNLKFGLRSNRFVGSSAKTNHCHYDNAKKKSPTCNDLHDNGSCKHCSCSKEDTTTNNGTVCCNEGKRGENNKLIIQNGFCHCPSVANERTAILNGKTVNTAASKTSTTKAVTSSDQIAGDGSLAPPTLAQMSSASMSSCPSKIPNNNGNGTPSSGVNDSRTFGSGKEDDSSNCSSKVGSGCCKKSSVVTYYHYSHEMGKFTPSNGCDAMDKHSDVRVEQQRNSARCDRCPKAASNRVPECCHRDDAASHKNAHNEIMGTSDANCRATKACHHSSSEFSRTNHHNEVVKAYAVAPKICVSGDNPILKTGCQDDSELEPDHEENESGRVVSAARMRPHRPQDSAASATVDHDNCHCCSPTITRLAHQNNHNHNHEPSQSNSKLVRDFGLEKSLPNGHLPVRRAYPIKSQKPAHLSGYNPICRSNSELTAFQSNQDTNNNNGNLKVSAIKSQVEQTERVREGRPLFGKLRNSLLNQKSIPLSSSIASSQLSLVNYYSGTHFVPSIITPIKNLDVPGRQEQQQQQNPNNFDDNFILKRKTPNAGLKSHC